MNPRSDPRFRCLALLQTIVPYLYAQWVIEDPESHDYRVAGSILPDGEDGYDVAHRTGVIGQVFRSQKAILVPDAGSHPLYDAFDSTIDWEFAFPVFVDEQMTAVVNLEGAGRMDIREGIWRRICESVQETTQQRPPTDAPQADSSCLLNTRRVTIRANDGDQRSDIVEVARAIARSGESTLLVGDFPDLLRGRGPTLVEANQRSLGASYCYFGVERRLDLLATGATTQDDWLLHKNWWDTCNGRYEFALVSLP